jgi:hypothetical protein
MKTWTATATAAAPPAAVLAVLTDPEACTRWAPVPFDVEGGRSLLAGSSARVSGRLAGRRLGFDVDLGVAAFKSPGVRPLGESPSDARPQAESSPASISVRPKRGLAGRLLAEATNALLNAGALETTLSRLTREAALTA